jgi:hypothetical protein
MGGRNPRGLLVTKEGIRILGHVRLKPGGRETVSIRSPAFRRNNGETTRSLAPVETEPGPQEGYKPDIRIG